MIETAVYTTAAAPYSTSAAAAAAATDSTAAVTRCVLLLLPLMVGAIVVNLSLVGAGVGRLVVGAAVIEICIETIILIFKSSCTHCTRMQVLAG
jgi:hypothetical protein